MSKDIAAWEGEGGAAHGASGAGPIPMTGTPSQVEWAERIRSRVSDEFDRVAQSFRSVALTQSDANRADTEAILAILEEKRAAVLGRTQAGYFIRDWQEISDQVRQMISRDARHQAIRIKRTTTSPQRETQHGLLKGKNMNLRPLYDRIVVKRTEQQETTRNGIFIPDSAKEKPQEGVVIAVGHGKRLDDGNLVALDVKAGDRILFGKYSGSESKLGGTDYIVMREEDVFGILDGAPNAVPTTG